MCILPSSFSSYLLPIPCPLQDIGLFICLPLSLFLSLALFHTLPWYFLTSLSQRFFSRSVALFRSDFHGVTLVIQRFPPYTICPVHHHLLRATLSNITVTLLAHASVLPFIYLVGLYLLSMNRSSFEFSLHYSISIIFFSTRVYRNWIEALVPNLSPLN